MKKYLLIILLLNNFFNLQAQTLYNPQLLYEEGDGLYDTDYIRDIYINFYDPNYDNILQTNWEQNTGLRLPASLQLDGVISLDSVGVRYKGNSTFAIAQDLNNPKLPLNIDINEYVGDQHIMNYKKIKLANSLFDPTFCKEITAYNIYKKYLPSPEANFMNVHVQGQLLGCYVNTQSVDRTFLNQHFNENDGVFFKCDPIQQFGQPGPSGNSDLSWKGTDLTSYYNHYDLKSDQGWEELMNLIYTLNFNLSEIDSILNVDRVLWAFAVNTVLANLDTYNGLYQHNYYLYQTGDGLFQMIPWDLTESFMGALLGHNSNPNLLYEYDPYNGYNSWYHPLVYFLISDSTNNNAFYRKIYTAHLRTIIEESLDANIIENYRFRRQATCPKSPGGRQWSLRRGGPWQRGRVFLNRKGGEGRLKRREAMGREQKRRAGTRRPEQSRWSREEQSKAEQSRAEQDRQETLGLEQLKEPKETLSMRQYKLDLLQTEIMLQTLEQSLKKPVRRRKKAEPQLTLSTEIEAEKAAQQS